MTLLFLVFPRKRYLVDQWENCSLNIYGEVDPSGIKDRLWWMWRCAPQSPFWEDVSPAIVIFSRWPLALSIFRGHPSLGWFTSNDWWRQECKGSAILALSGIIDRLQSSLWGWLSLRGLWVWITTYISCSIPLSPSLPQVLIPREHLLHWTLSLVSALWLDNPTYKLLYDWGHFCGVKTSQAL